MRANKPQSIIAKFSFLFISLSFYRERGKSVRQRGVFVLLTFILYFRYMTEIWKNVVGYEGLYQVSSIGRVKNTKKNKLLKQRFRGKGYLAVSLNKNGCFKDYYVHRLVAEAFIPNLDNLPQVNHKSEVKTDNRVDNLEWCTVSYNINYGTRGKRAAINRNLNRNLGHKGKNPRKIHQYTLDGCFIKTWNSSKEIQISLGFYYKCIQKCCRGIYKQSYGYRWCYENIEAI